VALFSIVKVQQGGLVLVYQKQPYLILAKVSHLNSLSNIERRYLDLSSESIGNKWACNNKRQAIQFYLEGA